MKANRAIIIQNLFFQRIRNNLRHVIIWAVHFKWSELFQEMKRIDTSINDGYKKYRKLQITQEELKKSEMDSIVRCPNCRKSNKDMKYNLTEKIWYCIECFDYFAAYYYLQRETHQKDYDQKWLKSFTNEQ